MELGVGSILDGKVTGITKFGAFISLPAGKTGMVHISEIAHSYVNNIRDHLTEGQEVKVKVINIDQEGRVNLSIKKTSEPVAAAATAVARPIRQDRERIERTHSGFRNSSDFSRNATAVREAPSFEDKLKQFMSDSDSRMSDLKLHTDKRSGAKRKK